MKKTGDGDEGDFLWKMKETDKGDKEDFIGGKGDGWRKLHTKDERDWW